MSLDEKYLESLQRTLLDLNRLHLEAEENFHSAEALPINAVTFRQVDEARIMLEQELPGFSVLWNATRFSYCLVPQKEEMRQNFEPFIASHPDWILKIKFLSDDIAINATMPYDRVSSLDEVCDIIRAGKRGARLRVRLFAGIDEYGDIEHGRAVYVIGDRLQLYKEVRSCQGLYALLQKKLYPQEEDEACKK